MKKVKKEIPTKKAVSSEMLIAVFAIIISVSTLVVYIYQSNLMKQQQKMSVWPHLTYGPSWGADYLNIILINRGIGPAILEKVDIEVDGQALEGVHQIMELIPDSLQSNYNYSSIWPGMVVMSGENIEMLQIREPKTVSYLMNAISDNRILIKICYRSVYGDTWVTNGYQVIEMGCG